jgi:hypothetical protein
LRKHFEALLMSETPPKQCDLNVKIELLDALEKELGKDERFSGTKQKVEALKRFKWLRIRRAPPSPEEPRNNTGQSSTQVHACL